jgi:thiamine biosynthesis lipoprotein
MNNNHFLKIITLFLIILLTGCTSLKKTEQTQELMGTFVTITVYDEENAEDSIEKAFNEIKRIDNLLSEYKDSSEVSKLNKQSYLTKPSEELIYNLERSIYYGNLTDGSFDITVKPILDLYSISFEEYGEPPTDRRIKTTLLYVDYSKIRINKKNNVIVLSDSMKITLGGITKGYAIDKAIEVLKREGVKHALVNAGGDMRAIGSKPKESWNIALQNPRNKKELITTIPLNNTAVATSGDYERYYDDEKKFHHIVNPKTGYSATELISVTIIADNAMDADALATSVFVMGTENGLELIESLDNVEGLIITKEKEIIKSSGFPY